MKRTVLLITVVLIAALALPALARGNKMDHHGDRRHAGEHGMELMFSKLDLTDAQRDQIAAIQKDQALARFDHREAMRNLRTEKRKLMKDTNADKATVYALIDKMAAMEANREKNRFDNHDAIKNILTEEQVKKLEQFKETHKEKFSEKAREHRSKRSERHSNMKGRSDRMRHSGRDSREMDRGCSMRHSKKMGQGHEMMMDKLNLSDEQKTKMTALRREQVGEKFDYKQAMKEIRQDKREIFQQDNVDKNKVYSLIDLKAKMTADWHKQTYDHRMKMKEILTPEQLAQIEEMKDHHKDKAKNRRKRK